MTDSEPNKDQLIAELRQRVAELEDTEQRYFNLFENAGDAIYIIDLVTLKIIAANSGAARRLGYTQDELQALTLDDIEILPEADDLQMLSGWESSMSGTHTYECHYRRKNGSLMPVEVTSRVLVVNGRQVQQNAVRNISKRKQAELELRESNERLSILRQIDTVLAHQLDVGYVVEQALDAAMRLSHADTGFIGLAKGDNIRMVHALGYYTSEIGAVLSQNASIITRVARQQQAELILNVATDPDYVSFNPHTQAQMTFPLMSNEKLIGILSLETEQAHRFNADIFAFIRLLVARVAVAIDNANAYEEQTNLVVELDAFAHTVAHDLKNPLGIIQGYVSMLQEDFRDLPEDTLEDYLEKVASSSHKMNYIIKDLLLLAGVRVINEIEMHPIDMGEVVKEALSRLSLLIEEHQAEIMLPDAWQSATGYAGWVEEVWANYISNAIKYGGTPPRIELGSTQQADGMVCFWVKDNGRGIAPEQQERLFTQFTRLDATHVQGHGLGLSIVRRIIHKLGGQVGIESEVGVGSIFSFTLPTVLPIKT